MNCENCEQQHNGIYGSGRFCSSKCARGFSTKAKRKDINEKVSRKLEGRKRTKISDGTYRLKRRYMRGAVDTPKQLAYRKRCSEKYKSIREKKIATLPWEKLSHELKREVVIREQNGKCNRCGIDEWQGEKLSLEFEHKDGNNQNNKRENVEFLCPNCHSLTKTWRGRNVKLNREKCRHREKCRQITVTEEDYISALKTTPNIRQALIKLGIAPKGGNYKRAHRLLNEHNITQMGS